MDTPEPDGLTTHCSEQAAEYNVTLKEKGNAFIATLPPIAIVTFALFVAIATIIGAIIKVLFSTQKKNLNTRAYPISSQ